MASALTVLFLSCWLAGRSRMLGQTSYPKPSISLRPNGRVALGTAVTIRCWGQHQNVRFLLYKDGHPNALQEAEPEEDVTAFPIRSVSRRDAGSYRCRYRTLWDQLIWSEPSDPVELLFVEPSYPKPSISLRPSRRVAPGEAVTVQCRCECRGGRILLSKAGDPSVWRKMDVTEDVAELHIHSVSPKDTGSYSCQYRTQRDLPVWSEPSDPVELVVAEATDTAGPQQLDPPTTEPQGKGGTDSTAPDPTLPGSAEPGTRSGDWTSPSEAPKTDDTWGTIIRLALGVGVLLGLALILTKAAHGWRRDGH